MLKLTRVERPYLEYLAYSSAQGFVDQYSHVLSTPVGGHLQLSLCQQVPGYVVCDINGTTLRARGTQKRTLDQ